MRARTEESDQGLTMRLSDQGKIMGLGVETNTSPSSEEPVETKIKEWVVGPPVARTYGEMIAI